MCTGAENSIKSPYKINAGDWVYFSHNPSSFLKLLWRVGEKIIRVGYFMNIKGKVVPYIPSLISKEEFLDQIHVLDGEVLPFKCYVVILKPENIEYNLTEKKLKILEKSAQKHLLDWIEQAMKLPEQREFYSREVTMCNLEPQGEGIEKGKEILGDGFLSFEEAVKKYIPLEPRGAYQSLPQSSPSEEKEPLPPSLKQLPRSVSDGYLSTSSKRLSVVRPFKLNNPLCTRLAPIEFGIKIAEQKNSPLLPPQPGTPKNRPKSSRAQHN